LKVLLTDKIDEAGIEILKRVAKIHYASSLDEGTLAEEAKDVDAMVVRVPAVITRRIIEQAKKLKVIARFGVGYDNIDVSAATDNCIPVTYTPGANTLAVAEYTVTLIMALAKQLMIADKALREHRWEVRLDYSGIEIAGKRLGIVGLGKIGAEVARLSVGLGMHVQYWSRTRKVDKERTLGIDYVPFRRDETHLGLNVPKRLLEESDFISIHLALTNETRGFIGKKEIAHMNDGAFLINTARGEIVSEMALLDALTSGKLGGAGLDAFEDEPPYRSPLLKLESVVVSPHVAAVARDTSRRMSIMVAEDTVKALSNQRPRFVVNPQVMEVAGRSGEKTDIST
jgi:D-3-phosphoglycerate dehydrogenase